MDQRKRRGKPYEPPKRKARGFLPAGGLIGTQLRTAQARRGFAQARLRAQWPEIAGPDLAALCWPEKLTPSRGPAGGLLKIGVSGAQAPVVQMMIPALRDRINAALGPGTVGRIQLTHSLPPASGAAPQPQRAQAPQPERALPAPVAEEISSIGDDELREVLKTLARNVLSRARTSRTDRNTDA